MRIVVVGVALLLLAQFAVALIVADDKAAPQYQQRATLVDSDAHGGKLIDLQWFETRPSDDAILDALEKHGAVSFPVGAVIEKSACDDPAACAVAVKEACRAIKSKVRVQSWDIAQGCSGTCESGIAVTVVCAAGWNS